MFLRIDVASEKKLAGKKLPMSFTNNRTGELWQSFMSRRSEIVNVVGTDLYSLQIYRPGYFANFNPQVDFEKFALAEVKDFDAIPQGMTSLILPAGRYAVFLHRGPASQGRQTFDYIFGTWLPQSEYELDDRPHFEILGAKYKKDDPESEEEIWIPIRDRK